MLAGGEQEMRVAERLTALAIALGVVHHIDHGLRSPALAAAAWLALALRPRRTV